MSNEGNFRRRTAMTMFKDAINLADSRLKEIPKTESIYYFWEREKERMIWVIEQLKTRRLGKIK